MKKNKTIFLKHFHKYFINRPLSPGAYTIKLYGFVMCRLPNKLVCLIVQASVFVKARRHQLSMKFDDFQSISNSKCFIIQAPVL